MLPLALTVVFSANLQAQSAPGIIHTVTNPANGHTYHLLDQSNWTDAETEAIALGGHLVTVNDLAENDFLIAEFSFFGAITRHLWTGYNDELVEGTWVWADGDPSAYTYWNPGEPNNSFANDPIHGEDYAAMYPSGPWVDLNDASTLTWFPVLNGVVEIGSPLLSISGLVGGGIATINVSNATAGGAVLLGYSLSGAGPTMTPYGPVDMSPPISLLPSLTADPSGLASMSTGVPGRATGFTLYMQGVDLASGLLTSSLAETVL
ncbi:MAG: hypothetical protein GY747_00135 [Planctomycetes bacterium]|nr:hypothetical protein [Planctomycetota bacterium]MCP4770633.1 hypothetical protein [Planctomycetota bacterium]MCP4861040.1 hypothetical protein [Planctomycetota bacterium]